MFGKEGVRKARSLRRLPEEQRWNHEAVMSVRGSPLQPNPGENDIRIRTKMDPGIPADDNLHAPITKEEIAREAGEPRPFYLMRSDVRKASEIIGYTKGCPGCRATERNYVSRPVHIPECRLRMEAEI